jgi:penicillin-binding protein 1A
MEYMAVALQGVADKPPEMPEGLARARIDPDTGLLARLDDDGAIMELFEAGRLPPMPEAGQGESHDAALEEDPYEIF